MRRSKGKASGTPPWGGKARFSPLALPLLNLPRSALTKHAINVIIDGVMATQPSVPHNPRRQTALALSVGLFLFAVYLFSYRGGFHSVDEVSMFAVTESLVKFGRLNTDQIAWTQWTTSQREAQGFFGVDGHVYSKKGLALSLAMAPLYALGLVTPGLGMLQVTSLLNAIQPGLGLRVREVSRGEQGKGLHTTTHLEMFLLDAAVDPLSRQGT